MTETVPTADRRREVLGGVGVTLGGLVLLVAALMIDEPSRSSPGLGPTALPLAISAGLIACGLFLSVRALRGGDDDRGLEDDLLSEAADDLDEMFEEDHEPLPWRSLGVVIGLMAVYAAIFVPVGFIVSTTLFLFAMTTFVHPAKWLRNLIVAVVLAVGVYFLFRDGLAVQLPVGLLG